MIKRQCIPSQKAMILLHNRSPIQSPRQLLSSLPEIRRPRLLSPSVEPSPTSDSSVSFFAHSRQSSLSSLSSLESSYSARRRAAVCGDFTPLSLEVNGEPPPVPPPLSPRISPLPSPVSQLPNLSLSNIKLATLQDVKATQSKVETHNQQLRQLSDQDIQALYWWSTYIESRTGFRSAFSLRIRIERNNRPHLTAAAALFTGVPICLMFVSLFSSHLLVFFLSQVRSIGFD